MTKCPHCGSAPRSNDDHKRFFALIAAAYDQWPESHEFQPDSAEHLRSWLLCKINYRNTTMVETSTDPKAAVLVVEAAFKAAGSYAFVRPYGDGLAVYAPKSIAWDKLDQKQFGPVRDEVSGLIESVLSVTAEQLLNTVTVA